MAKNSSEKTQLSNIPTYDRQHDCLHVIIETPKGRRNKYKYDEDHRLFKLGAVLPAGASFPLDFGFVPSTLGQDGDPLDVLVFMDEPAHVGCLVQARLIGVLEAKQTEDGHSERNDRLVAVALASHDHQELNSLRQLSPHLIKEIEHFFVSYNQVKGKKFKILGCYGPARAQKLVKQGMLDFRKASFPGRAQKK